MKKKNGFITIFSVVMMVFLSAGFTPHSKVYAADAAPGAKADIPFTIQKADGTPAVENDDYTVDGIVIDFNKSGQYKIIGDGQEVTDKASFHVGNNFEGEITLKDVKVNLNGIRSAFKVESDAKLTLWLEGNNSLRGGDYCAAIEFMNASSGYLIIDAVNADASLWVQGWNGAAIGGAAEKPGEGDEVVRNVSNIEIRGGNITATSMVRDGTAIGVVGNSSIFSTAKPTLSNLVISGGTITTDCNETESVGIGAGKGGYIESLKITGGTIVAEGYGNSAAIGMGDTASIGCLEITGGNITAVAHGDGAAIGSGTDGTVGNIIISGGNIQATSNGISTAIGVGPTRYSKYPATLDTLQITGGTIEAVSQGASYSIGAEKDEQIQNLQIDGGTLKAAAIPACAKNSEGKELALLTLQNMANVQAVTIGGHNMNVFGNHAGDSNYYFYLPKEPQAVTIKKQDQSEVTINYTWNGTGFVKQQSKQENAWETEPSIEGWTYKSTPKQPSGKAKYGDITYTYSDQQNGPYGVLPKDAHAGVWYMKAQVQETSAYTGLEIVKAFTISKADSKINITTQTMDKAYDEKPVMEPKVEKTGSTKEVSLTWYEKKGDIWQKIDTAPKNAGSYKVEAVVEADDNYNSAAAEKLFEIKKAIPSYTLPQELVIKQGETLSSVQLPTGFTWADPAQKAENLGTQTFKAVFTPADTMNYENVEVDIYVNVVPTSTPINAVPTIQAENKTLTVGDAFDVMAGVSAQDAEDGDLSTAIEVVKNTVDLSNPGIYEVTYKVTDREGASVTKSITVTVRQATLPSNQLPTIQAENKTLTVGDAFDVMAGVSAQDAEDGDLSTAIEVVKNTVDLSKPGIYEVTYKVTDREGASVTKSITVTVRQAALPSNQLPTIQAENKTLMVGDAFDAMAGVSAQDAEDGDLSTAIEVVKNTVDLSKPGIYEVTYKVTDRAGAFVTKTITVTVKEKAQEQPTTPALPTTPDGGSSSSHTGSNVNQNTVIVQTGDEMNLLVWGSTAILSLAGVVLILSKKKAKT